MLILWIFSASHEVTKYVSLPGSGQCAAMELGTLEGGYLELLNSSADPLQLYHLCDQLDLAGEEEIELCSGGLSFLWPLPSPASPLSLQWQQPGQALAAELRSAPRTAPARLGAPLQPHPAFLPSPPGVFPGLSCFTQGAFPPQNPTQTPSTVNSSAGCCAT